MNTCQGPECPGWSSLSELPGPARGPMCRSGSHAPRWARPHRGRETHVDAINQPHKGQTVQNTVFRLTVLDLRVCTAQRRVSGSYRLRKQADRLHRDRNCLVVIWLPVWLTCEDTQGLWEARDSVRFTRIPGSKAPGAQILSVGPGTPDTPSPEACVGKGLLLVKPPPPTPDSGAH